MRAKKILVFNGTSHVLHVQAFVEDGEFLIILHRRMPLGRCDTVAPGMTASYPVNEAVSECITAAQRLNYVISNRIGEPITFATRPDRKLEAIVVVINARGN